MSFESEARDIAHMHAIPCQRGASLIPSATIPDSNNVILTFLDRKFQGTMKPSTTCGESLLPMIPTLAGTLALEGQKFPYTPALVQPGYLVNLKKTTDVAA